MSIFKKEDIKAGYLLKVKDTETGETFNMTVVPTTAYVPDVFARILLEAIDRQEGDLAVCCPGAHWWPVNAFSDELRMAINDKEVVAVYGYTTPKFLLNNSTEGRELLWEREEEQPTEDTQPEVKKTTVAEIAKVLGHPVEIVEG